MIKNAIQLKPEYYEGRIFLSPILGCQGRCSYCYLPIKSFTAPQMNNLLIKDVVKLMQDNPNFSVGRNGTIISIGAWGDIFPPNNVTLIEHSVSWICNLLQLGNPIQIMSKFSLAHKYITEICNSSVYTNQLLYSTTITCLSKWDEIEFGTDSPYDRIKTCSEFGRNGVATNVMIKPFLPGVTDQDIKTLAKLIKDNNINYCVAGILYWDDKIIKSVEENSVLKYCMDAIMSKKGIRSLDCNGVNLLNAYSTDTLNNFIEVMKSLGISVFKKSSCINSNLLNRYNQSDYFKVDPENYCIKCGNCEGKK